MIDVTWKPASTVKRRGGSLFMGRQNDAGRRQNIVCGRPFLWGLSGRQFASMLVGVVQQFGNSEIKLAKVDPSPLSPWPIVYLPLSSVMRVRTWILPSGSPRI